MAKPARNLLLLTIDAWRADFVDSFAGVTLLPTLQQQLGRAVRFDRCYATAPWTSPALLSLFTGESPARHGVHHAWSAPRAGGPALARTLQAAGYRTPNVCYVNSARNYTNLGYAAAEAPDCPTSPNDDLLPRTLARLRNKGGRQPWFVWYHYKHVHLPYWPAPAYRRLFGVDDATLPERLRISVASRIVVPRSQFKLHHEDRELVRRLYAGAVRQMDDFLARVFAELSADGLLDRTTVVLTADHGDELLEHGHVGHASTSHHATLFEEVLRIPLFVIDGRIAAGRRVTERVQGLDLFPTLLSLVGVAPARRPVEAVDLSPLILQPDQPPPLAVTRPRLFYAGSSRMGFQTPRGYAGHYIHALSDGQTKYIREVYDTSRRLLFDLRGPTDRLEQDAFIDEVAVAAADRLLAAYLSGGALPAGPLPTQLSTESISENPPNPRHPRSISTG